MKNHTADGLRLEEAPCKEKYSFCYKSTAILLIASSVLAR